MKTKRLFGTGLQKIVHIEKAIAKALARKVKKS